MEDTLRKNELAVIALLSGLIRRYNEEKVDDFSDTIIKTANEILDVCDGKISPETRNCNLSDVIGRSEQFICPDCNKPEKEYRDGLCEMCHKWHTGQANKLPITTGYVHLEPARTMNINNFTETE